MTRPVHQIVEDLDKYPEGSDRHREILRELDEYWKDQNKKGCKCGK